MGCYLEFGPIYSFLICFMWPITLNVYPATFETHLTTNILLCVCIHDVLYFVFFSLSFSSSLVPFYSFIICSIFFPPFLSCRHLYFFFCILLIYLVIYLFLFSLIYLFKLSYYMFSCFISSTNHTAGAHDPCYFTFFFSFHFSLIFLRYLFPSTFSFLFLILSF